MKGCGVAVRKVMISQLRLDEQMLRLSLLIVFVSSAGDADDGKNAFDVVDLVDREEIWKSKVDG